MKVLYAGDSPAGGPANYLLAILRSLRIPFTHIPPSEKLSPRLMKTFFDAIILSDFSRKNLPQKSEKMILDQISKGSGLLMVGGWGSFSGPFGKWHGSLIEKILPVQCLNQDDRLNFPGGALMHLERRHLMFGKLSFSNPPVICGMNRVQVKSSGRILLSAKRITDGRRFPLLVVDSNYGKKIAALTTDLAPHWCGGMVDWGNRSVKLPVNSKIFVEVGNSYIGFVSSLIQWLVRK